MFSDMILSKTSKQIQQDLRAVYSRHYTVISKKGQNRYNGKVKFNSFICTAVSAITNEVDNICMFLRPRPYK